MSHSPLPSTITDRPPSPYRGARLGLLFLVAVPGLFVGGCLLELTLGLLSSLGPLGTEPDPLALLPGALVVLGAAAVALTAFLLAVVDRSASTPTLRLVVALVAGVAGALVLALQLPQLVALVVDGAFA